MKPFLYPKNTATRIVQDLSGNWEFKFDWKGEGYTNNWKDGLEDTLVMPVPSSFADLFTDKDSREFTGDAWYETDFYLPKEWEDKNVNIRFASVTHYGTVFVNGKKVVEHRGGYMPFNANLKEVGNFGGKNKLVVVSNNELSYETIPPGATKTLGNGKKMTKPFFDFFNYAGIIRPVKIQVTPSNYIDDVSIVTNIEGDTGIVSYAIDGNLGNYEIKINVLDEGKKVVATATGKEGEIKIEKANLWKVRDAYLYDMQVCLVDGERIVDEYIQEFGIRTVKIDGTKILINGKEIYLTGFGKHEDSAINGRGYNPVVNKRDFELLEWINANSFRTAHYPYSEEIYQLADRYGVLVIDETPAVGFFDSLFNALDASRGKKDNEIKFFERDSTKNILKPYLKEVINELIQRDKNHPSVIMWSLLNEPDTTIEAAVPFFEEVFAYAKEVDPQKRPCTFANIMMAPIGVCKCHHVADVIMLNRYYGWYMQAGYEMSDAFDNFKKELSGWGKLGKPVVMSEYGADTVAGIHKLPSTQFSEEYQIEYLDMQHEVFDSFEFIKGEQMWNFADFQTVEGFYRVDGNKKGAFTRDRQPKAAAFSLKKRWEKFN